MTPQPTGRIIRRTNRGADLVIERTLRGEVDDVWHSVTTPDSTARWIGPWDGDAGPGKTVILRMAFEEGQPTCPVVIEECHPPTRLVVSMTDDAGSWHMSLDLRAEASGTVLTLRQRLEDPGLAKDTGPGWEYYLDRIVAARDGAEMPDFDDYYPSQQRHYLDAITEAGY